MNEPASSPRARAAEAVFWLLCVVHTLGAGTDAGQAWILLPAAVVVVSPLVLIGSRLRPRLAQGLGHTAPGTRTAQPPRLGGPDGFAPR